MWTHEIVGTVTGDRLQNITLASNSWAVRMNGQIGSGESVIETSDPMYEGWSDEFWMDITKPWARTIVGKYQNGPVWGHVITGRSYDLASGQLRIRHAEVGELLKKRLFFPVTGYSNSAFVEFGPFTRAGMLTSVARHACGGGYWADVTHRRLPVHFDTPATGGWTRRTYQHEFEHPWNWMTAIADGDPGVDFVFAAGFGSDSGEGGEIAGFQWVFHTGSPIERSTHEYSVTAPESPVLSASIDWDAVDHATGVFALGEGQGSARPVGRVGSLETPEVPRVINLGQEASVASLDAAAMGEWSAVRVPAEVWSIQLNADRVLAPMHGGVNDGLRPGSRLVLQFQDDPVMGSGSREFYVVGMSGGLGSVVTVEGQLL